MDFIYDTSIWFYTNSGEIAGVRFCQMDLVKITPNLAFYSRLTEVSDEITTDDFQSQRSFIYCKQSQFLHRYTSKEEGK